MMVFCSSKTICLWTDLIPKKAKIETATTISKKQIMKKIGGFNETEVFRL